MELRIGYNDKNLALMKEVEEISGQPVMLCYQCGKCSSSCPMADDMDYLPNQVMKFIQIGATEKILEGNTPWICAECFNCTVECPKGIDIASVMEALRLHILRKNIDVLRIESIAEDDVEELPPIALVSAMRKLTG